MQLGLGIGIGFPRGRGGGPAPYVGPLDYRAGAFGAWGLRKLYSAYEGPAVRVRRSTDDAEMDIGFAADGSFDAATANSFKGGGSLFAVTLYDQSGNDRHFSEGTAANQPLVSADGPDGNWALTFDGSNDRMTTPSFSRAQPATYYCGFNPLFWSAFDTVFDGIGTGNQNIFMQFGTTPAMIIYAQAATTLSESFALTTWHTAMALFNGASSALRRAKNAAITGVNPGSAGITAGLCLGLKGDLSGGGTNGNFRLSYLAMFGAADDTTAQDAAIDALAGAFGIAV